MDGAANLVTALAVFVGTHFLMSHPLRARMVAALGGVGFQITYSLVSLGTFVWMLFVYGNTPGAAPLWAVGELSWWIATVLMLLGSILFVGSFMGNPALPAPGAAERAKAPARGVFAITRHPMMWGFALWSLVHILASPTPKVIILCIGLGFLALAGSAGQDRKKAALMGESWQDWASRTAFTPFGLQASGRAGWKSAWPGRTAVLLGTLLWLGATYAHAWFDLPAAGIWHWIWG